MISLQNIGSVTVLKAKLSLTSESLSEATQIIQQSLARCRPFFVLDLSDCALIASCGLELILDTQMECLKRGGKLVIAEPQNLVREILRITVLDERVAVFDDMRRALSDFSK